MWKCIEFSNCENFVFGASNLNIIYRLDGDILRARCMATISYSCKLSDENEREREKKKERKINRIILRTNQFSRILLKREKFL